MTRRRRAVALALAIALFSAFAIFWFWTTTLRRVSLGETLYDTGSSWDVRDKLDEYSGPLRASFIAHPLEIDFSSFFPRLPESSQRPTVQVEIGPIGSFVLWAPPQLKRFRLRTLEWVPVVAPQAPGRPTLPPDLLDFNESIVAASRALEAEFDQRLSEYAGLAEEERSLQIRMWGAHLEIRRAGDLDLAPLPADWLDPAGSMETRHEVLRERTLHLEDIARRFREGGEIIIPEPLRRAEAEDPLPADRAPLPDFAFEAWESLAKEYPRTRELSISATPRGRRARVGSRLEAVGRLLPLEPAETIAARLAATVETVTEISGTAEERARLRTERRRIELEHFEGVTAIEITRASTKRVLETLRALEKALELLPERNPSVLVREIRISGDPREKAGWRDEAQLPRRAVRASVLTIPVGASRVVIRDWFVALRP